MSLSLCCGVACSATSAHRRICSRRRSSQQHNAAACLSRDWRRQPRTATGCGYRCERSSSSRNSSNRPRIAAASQSTDAGLQQGGAEPVVASVGDVVTLKWKCFDGQGEVGRSHGL